MAIGIWSGATRLAVALGPVIGGLLLDHFWWGSMFLVNVPIVVVGRLSPAAHPGVVRPVAPDAWTSGATSVGGIVAASCGRSSRHLDRGWTSVDAWYWPTGLVCSLRSSWQEPRIGDPLLDVCLFRNARFTAASVAIASAFFGLFGFIFLITQYMQLVQGYSPLQAGLRTVPFAVVTGVFSPVSIAIMHRIGSKAVVTIGLTLMSLGFAMASTLSADSAYFGPVLASMVTIAAGLGLTTSPATEAIMGALPSDKAGVGSAVNDTTRELGGTLGVAIVGSVFASLYGPQIVDGLKGFPEQVVALVEESMGAAVALSEQIPQGAVLLEAAQTAFMSGFQAGSIVAAAATALGAVLALLWLPARHRLTPTT